MGVLVVLEVLSSNAWRETLAAVESRRNPHDPIMPHGTVHTNNGTSFGQWLKQRRKARDLTQEQLADLAGCAPRYVRKLERGERRPSEQMVKVLAEQLGVPVGQLGGIVSLARLGPGAKAGR